MVQAKLEDLKEELRCCKGEKAKLQKIVDKSSGPAVKPNNSKRKHYPINSPRIPQPNNSYGVPYSNPAKFNSHETRKINYNH